MHSHMDESAGQPICMSSSKDPGSDFHFKHGSGARVEAFLLLIVNENRESLCVSGRVLNSFVVT